MGDEAAAAQAREVRGFHRDGRVCDRSAGGCERAALRGRGADTSGAHAPECPWLSSAPGSLLLSRMDAQNACLRAYTRSRPRSRTLWGANASAVRNSSIELHYAGSILFERVHDNAKAGLCSVCPPSPRGRARSGSCFVVELE